MLTLIHAPNTRSSRILTLIEEMDIRDKIAVRTVDICRMDGSGHRDATNPHPDGKVPALLHGETLVTETAAIMLYLTDLFPETGMAPAAQSADRGRFLSWLFWYGANFEPALITALSGHSHPAFAATWRSKDEAFARIRAALERGPWLVGDSYSAADLLVASPFGWRPQELPDDALIRDWAERCLSRPSLAVTRARDAEFVQQGMAA